MAEIVPSVKIQDLRTYMTLFELLMRKKTKESIVSSSSSKDQNVKERRKFYIG